MWTVGNNTHLLIFTFIIIIWKDTCTDNYSSITMIAHSFYSIGIRASVLPVCTSEAHAHTYTFINTHTHTIADIHILFNLLTLCPGWSLTGVKRHAQRETRQRDTCLCTPKWSVTTAHLWGRGWAGGYYGAWQQGGAVIIWCELAW